jgi:hypothetical protein
MAFDECSMQQLLEPVITEHAKRLASRPEYQAALRAKAEDAAKQAGQLRRLDEPPTGRLFAEGSTSS